MTDQPLPMIPRDLVPDLIGDIRHPSEADEMREERVRGAPQVVVIGGVKYFLTHSGAPCPPEEVVVRGLGVGASDASACEVRPVVEDLAYDFDVHLPRRIGYIDIPRPPLDFDSREDVGLDGVGWAVPRSNGRDEAAQRGYFPETPVGECSAAASRFREDSRDVRVLLLPDDQERPSTTQDQSPSDVRESVAIACDGGRKLVEEIDRSAAADTHLVSQADETRGASISGTVPRVTLHEKPGDAREREET